jgi:hypothetical protein
MSEDNWSDVVVPTATEEGKIRCEKAVQSVIRSWRRTDLEPRVVRSCSLEPLPAPAHQRPPHHLLVNRDRDFPARQAMDDLLAGAPREPEPDVEVTQYTRFSTEEACQAVVDRLSRKHEEAERNVAQASHEWLEQQAARQDAARETDCRGAEEASARLEAVRHGPRSKKRAMDLAMCELEQRRLEEACKRSTELARLVRGKLADMPAPRPSTLDVACIPD